MNIYIYRVNPTQTAYAHPQKGGLGPGSELRHVDAGPSPKNEVDALGVITISRGCFERSCSKKKPRPTGITV